MPQGTYFLLMILMVLRTNLLPSSKISTLFFFQYPVHANRNAAEEVMLLYCHKLFKFDGIFKILIIFFGFKMMGLDGFLNSSVPFNAQITFNCRIYAIFVRCNALKWKLLPEWYRIFIALWPQETSDGN